MNGTRLAIVGASVRAAAWSAAGGGYDCLALDMFADADLAGLCPVVKIERFDDRLLGLLAESDVDAWIYAGGMENHPQMVAWLIDEKGFTRARADEVVAADGGFDADRCTLGELRRVRGEGFTIDGQLIPHEQISDDEMRAIAEGEHPRRVLGHLLG